MSDEGAQAVDEVPSGRSPPVIPRRESRLGQSDRPTAVGLWAIIGVTCLYAAAVPFGASAALVVLGRFTLAGLTVVVGPPLALGAAYSLWMRAIASDRRAGYRRLAQKLKRAHPCARILLVDPPFRLFGVGLIHGRRGLAVLTPERAVVVAQRVPLWLVGVCVGGVFFGGPQLGGVALPALLAVGACVLAMLSGADVYEIDYRDLEVTDAEEGHVRWGQSGDDAPRVLRFRLTHPEDPACVVTLLGGSEALDGASGH